MRAICNGVTSDGSDNTGVVGGNHYCPADSIDRAVAVFPEAEMIFERNIETMENMGHEGWKKLWLV